jgi:hypothetical protein
MLAIAGLLTIHSYSIAELRNKGLPTVEFMHTFRMASLNKESGTCKTELEP